MTAFDDLFPDFLARVKTGLEGIEWQGELGPARGGVIFSCRIAPTALDHGQKGVSVILEDITDRKRADEALRESEEKFRRIFEDGPLGMTLIDCNFRFSLVNRTFCEMLGYTGDELAGKSFADVTHPAHILRNKEKMRLLHTGKIPLIRDEKQYLRKDGSVLWASVTVTPLRDRKNRVTSSISIVEDITDRKQAEMQLRESEQKFREFADFLPQSVWACDLSGNLIFANRGSFSMYRYNPDDFERNLTIWQVISPGDRSIISALIAEALSKPIDQFPATVEYTALRKDGSTFPIKTYVAPVISDGVITGLRGIGIDMTDQKRTEEALQESEDRFRRVFEDGPLGMVIVDSDHRFVSVNRMCCEMFGYSEQDLLGKTIEKVTHPDHNDQDAAEMQKLYAGTISRYRTRKRYIRKDGSVIWGSLTVSPLRDRTGKIVSTMGLVEEIADQSKDRGKRGFIKPSPISRCPGYCPRPGDPHPKGPRPSGCRPETGADRQSAHGPPGRPHCVDTLSCRRYNEVETDREMSGAIRNAREPAECRIVPLK